MFKMTHGKREMEITRERCVPKMSEQKDQWRESKEVNLRENEIVVLGWREVVGNKNFGMENFLKKDWNRK